MHRWAAAHPTSGFCLPKALDHRIKPRGIFVTAPVLPSDGGQQGVALVIDKHMGVDLRAQANGCYGALVKLRKRGAHASHPVIR